jgi:arginase
MTQWTIIGVPSSAGAHHAGQELAPAALRAAGLLERLAAAGVTVTDAGDLPGAVFEVDSEHPRARNLAAVTRVAREVAAAVADVVARGTRLLVVGGDCTITLGVVAGLRRSAPGVGLAYVDGDADLYALDSEFSGILDAAGIAHLLGLGAPELNGFDGTPPLLEGSSIAMIGCDPREVTAEGRKFIADAGISFGTAEELSAYPEGEARRALSALATGDSRVIVHFDVDVIDSGDLPLGNFPHYGSGVRLEHAVRCLRVLLADPRCAALVLTEVNPTHDPSGGQLARYVAGLATALAG